MKRCRVVCVRGRKREELEADPDFVYCGRRVFRTKWDEPSPWANTFKDLDKFIAHVVQAMKDDPEWLARARADLHGKLLGCWCIDDDCRDPKRPVVCHAQWLARLINSRKD